MEKILVFTKEQWIAIFQFCGFAFSVATVIYAFLHKNIKLFFEVRKKFYTSLDERFDKVYKILDINNEGTKTALLLEINRILTSCERYDRIISSSLMEILKKAIDKYNGMGNGLDGGHTIQERLNNLIVDDVKFHDLQTKINNKKHKIIEEE